MNIIDEYPHTAVSLDPILLFEGSHLAVPYLLPLVSLVAYSGMNLGAQLVRGFQFTNLELLK